VDTSIFNRFVNTKDHSVQYTGMRMVYGYCRKTSKKWTGMVSGAGITCPHCGESIVPPSDV